ncbi:MSCRAMM family protein [Lacticaseibacillus brantae]|uniref:MSCRAMM family protein n=1 Tax=Lacticaseibacillus brantae TaxID=943673 RepID=UPI00070AA004|nr:SpaA isopeptide-forming pilin-related protein [Lacticaseibacillus brantae]
MIKQRSLRVKIVHLAMLVVMLVSALMSPIQAVRALAGQPAILTVKDASGHAVTSQEQTFNGGVQLAIEPPKQQVHIPIVNGLSVRLVKVAKPLKAAALPATTFKGLYSVFAGGEATDLPKVTIKEHASFDELTAATKTGPVELDTINTNQQVIKSEVVVPANLKREFLLEFTNPLNRKFKVIATADGHQQTLFAFGKRSDRDVIKHGTPKTATEKQTKDQSSHVWTKKELALTRPMPNVVKGLHLATQVGTKPLAFDAQALKLISLAATAAAPAVTGLTLPAADPNDPKAGAINPNGISGDLLWPKEEVTQVAAQNDYAAYQKITKWYSSKNNGVADYYVIFRIYTGFTGKYAAQDGEAQLNADNAAGHDSSYTNNLVRVNDSMVYTVTATMNKIGDQAAHQVPESLNAINLYLRGNGTTTVPNAYSADTAKKLTFAFNQTGREATTVFKGKVSSDLDEGDKFTTSFSPMPTFDAGYTYTSQQITAKAVSAFQIRTVNQITGSGLASNRYGAIYDAYKAYGDAVGDKDYNNFTNLLAYGYVIMPQLSSDNPSGVGVNTKVGRTIKIQMNLQQVANFTALGVGDSGQVDYVQGGNVRDIFYGVGNFSTAAGQDQLKTTGGLTANASAGTKIWQLKNPDGGTSAGQYLPVHWNDSQILNPSYTNEVVSQWAVTATVSFDYVLPSDFQENYATFALFFKDRNNFAPGNFGINQYANYRNLPLSMDYSTDRQINLNSYQIDGQAMPLYTDYQVTQWQALMGSTMKITSTNRVYPTGLSPNGSLVYRDGGVLYAPNAATVAQAKSWGVESQLAAIYARYQVTTLTDDQIKAINLHTTPVISDSSVFPDNPVALRGTTTNAQTNVALPGSPFIVNPQTGAHYAVTADRYGLDVTFATYRLSGLTKTFSSHDINDSFTMPPTGVIVAGLESDPLLKTPFSANDQLIDWANKTNAYSQWKAFDVDKNSGTPLGTNRTDDVTTNAMFRLTIQLGTWSIGNATSFELNKNLDMMATWNSDAFYMNLDMLKKLVDNPAKYQDPFAPSFEASKDMTSASRFFDWSKIIKLGKRVTANGTNDARQWHFDDVAPANDTKDYQWSDWATVMKNSAGMSSAQLRQTYTAIRYDFTGQDVWVVDEATSSANGLHQPVGVIRSPLVFDSKAIGTMTNNNPNMIRASLQLPGTPWFNGAEMLKNPGFPTTLWGYTLSNGLPTSTTLSPGDWRGQWLNASSVGYRYAGKDISNEYLTQSSPGEQAGKANLVFSRRYYGYNGEPLTPGTAVADRFKSELNTSYVLITSPTAAQTTPDIRLVIPQNSQGYYRQSVDGVGLDQTNFASTYTLKTKAMTLGDNQTYQQVFSALAPGSSGSAYTDAIDGARQAQVLQIDWTDPTNSKALNDYYTALKQISGQTYTQGLPLTYALIGFDLSDIMGGKNNQEASFMTKDVFMANVNGALTPEPIAPAFDSLQSPSDASEQVLKNRAYVNVQQATSYGIKETIGPMPASESASSPGNAVYDFDTKPDRTFSIYITIDAKSQPLVNPYVTAIVPFMKDDVGTNTNAGITLARTGQKNVRSSLVLDPSTSPRILADQGNFGFYVSRDRQQSLLSSFDTLGTGSGGSGLFSDFYGDYTGWVTANQTYQHLLQNDYMNQTKAKQFGMRYHGTIQPGEQLVFRADFAVDQSFVPDTDYIKHESYLGFKGADTTVYPVSNIVKYQQKKTVGQIKFVKANADNHSQLLAGAKFMLARSQASADAIYQLIKAGKSTADILAAIKADSNLANNVVTNADGSVNVQTADTNGQGLFDQLALTNPTYWLIEIGAPSSYVLTDQAKADLVHQVDAVVQNPAGTAVTPVTVFNKKSTQPKLKLYKTDQNGQPLAGAVFQIWTDAALTKPLDPTKTYSTGADGQLDVSNLVLGNTYWVQEIKAPAGYELNGTAVKLAFTQDNLGRVVSTDGTDSNYISNSKPNQLIPEGGPLDPNKNYLTFVMADAPTTILPFTGSFMIWTFVILFLLAVIGVLIYWGRHGRGPLKSVLKVGLLLTIFATFGLAQMHSVAAASGEYGLTIQKYVDANGDPANARHDGAEDTSTGSGDVRPVTGINYTIQRILAGAGTPNYTDPSSYTVDPSFPELTLTTDAKGFAHVDLDPGFYLVKELAGNGVTQPMTPVIVQIPTTLVDGTRLNQVWLYPKSGVETPTIPPVPPVPPTVPELPNTHLPKIPPTAPLPKGRIPNTRIPQTSASMGNESQLWLLLLALIGSGSVGAWSYFHHRLG